MCSPNVQFLLSVEPSVNATDLQSDPTVPLAGMGFTGVFLEFRETNTNHV